MTSILGTESDISEQAQSEWSQPAIASTLPHMKSEGVRTPRPVGLQGAMPIDTKSELSPREATVPPPPPIE
jgi:hypothetical protein